MHRERKTPHVCGGCKKLQAVEQVNEMALDRKTSSRITHEVIGSRLRPGIL